MLSKVDESVWQLYKDGITATLNQADSDFARHLVMEYAPTRLSELASWVAAIRPGFASLLNNFLTRKPYSTGVKELDDLLEDSFHYMIYQESIMKFLNWLGIPEKDTYDTIKHIAKKKFTEEEISDLKARLKEGWIAKIGSEEGFDANWQVVEDAVRYSFNASHALSVAIDSLYGAYLKRKHTLEYMTVALNEYQGDIDKTSKIVKELPYFNITINPPRFRYSKAEYMFDKESNSIYKGIASIKFLNEKVSNELYNLKDRQFNSFTELVRTIMLETSINFKQLKILVKLNYFSEFGKNKKLFTIVENYESKLKNKSLKEKTVATRMTELIDNEKLMEDKPFDMKTQIQAETEFIGSPMIAKATLPDNVYSVLEIKNQNLKLYQIKTGEICDYRVKKTDIAKNDVFGQFNIIKVTGIKKQNKRKKNGDEWIVLKDEFNVYISSWDILL